MAGTHQELAKLKWEDPLLVDDLLTDDERMIRDTARSYAQEKLLPRVIEAYREERTDRAIFNGTIENDVIDSQQTAATVVSTTVNGLTHTANSTGIIVSTARTRSR